MDREDRSPPSLGALLKQHRQDANLTQKDLAERAQVSEHSISNLEREAPHAPRRDLVSLLATALRLSPQEEARLMDAALALRRPRPLRALPASPGNPTLVQLPPSLLLPAPVQPLVGRAPLLRSLKQQLVASDHPAFLALYGLPGVGKTTLALALVHDPTIRQHFADGILWAGLGAQPNVSAVLGAWGEALGIQPAGSARLPSLQAQARAVQLALGQRRMLLVIDDAWNAEVAFTLKVGGPDCVHLVTTRLPDVAARCVEEGTAMMRVQELGEVDGLALLSRLAPETVQLEPDEARALVRAVDGLPLALKLMGNYLRRHGYSGQPRRLHTALNLLRRSKERLRLGSSQMRPYGGAETAPSLMTSIGTSYQALDKRARSLLLALSAFPTKPNSFSEEAALAASGASPVTLDRLIDSGLLESSGSGRYMLHQTVADYARLKHRSKRTYQRMAEFYTSYVEAHRTDYRALDGEANNILAALQFAFEQRMYASLARGVHAFFSYLQVRGMYDIAEILLQQSHQVLRSMDEPARMAKVLLDLGLIAVDRGNFAQAEACWQEGLTLARSIGDHESISSLLQVLGGLAERYGDQTLAEGYLQEGLTLARQIHHQENICTTLRRMGMLAERRRNFAEAKACYQEALLLAREIGKHESVSALLTNLGILASDQGDFAQAETCYQEALALARQMGHVERISNLLNNLGDAVRNQGDYTRAHAFYQEGLTLARQMGLRELICFFLINLGEMASYAKEFQQAEACYQEGLMLARQIEQRELLGMVLTDLGELARERDNYKHAEVYLREGQSLAQEAQYDLLLAYNWNQWGELYLKQAHLDQAASAFQAMLTLAREIASRQLIATAWYGLARVAAALGHMTEAQQYGEESMSIFQAIGYFRAPEIAAWLVLIGSRPFSEA